MIGWCVVGNYFFVARRACIDILLLVLTCAYSATTEEHLFGLNLPTLQTGSGWSDIEVRGGIATLPEHGIPAVPTLRHRSRERPGKHGIEVENLVVIAKGIHVLQPACIPFPECHLWDIFDKHQLIS